MLYITINIISVYRNLTALNYVIRPYALRIALAVIVTAIKTPAEVAAEKDVIIKGIAELSAL
jgi:hypothetical protein